MRLCIVATEKIAIFGNVVRRNGLERPGSDSLWQKPKRKVAHKILGPSNGFKFAKTSPKHSRREKVSTENNI